MITLGAAVCSSWKMVAKCVLAYLADHFSQSCEFDRIDYVGCLFDRGDYVEAPAMSEQLSVCLPSGLLLVRAC